MIKLVIDSTCDLPQQLIEYYGIYVLPLQVIIENKSYRDGIDIMPNELYDFMRSGIIPQTAQISFEDTDTLFRTICKNSDDLIYLSFSSGMSGTFNIANLIANEIKEDYPNRNIEILDSEGGCAATGLIALQIARWIVSGKSFDEIITLSREMIKNVQHLFTLDSLNWLAKGGRIVKPVGFVGDKLQLKPIMHVDDKTMHVFKIVRGKKRTIDTLISILEERLSAFKEQLVFITHTDDPDTALTISEKIERAIPTVKTIIMPIGCVLASHLGIGGVGIFFLKAPVKGYDLLCESMLG